MRRLFLFLILCACGSITACAAEPDIVFADFEGKDYGEWQTAGTAFGLGPARGTLPNQMPVSGFAGQGLVNSYCEGDGSTGTLTSPEFNVDQIVLTDRKPNVLLAEQKREFVLEHRYLNLPVKNGAAKRRMSLLIGGRTVREFEIELADAQPDFWVFLEVTPFKGQAATLRVDKLPENSEGLKAIEQGETIKGAEDLYREKRRPQFHFSSRRGWNNDPNGLVFYQGEYHLFYQHNPYGWDWGNMHWGHAISADLVHWQELPIALYPQRFGDWAFSGSAVVDWKNTAGFKTGQEAALVAAYTSTGRGEAIAFSNDRGRTWAEFSGNPVVKHNGRDPRLLWHEPTQKWIMAVYDELDGKRWIAFYNSPDLKTWELQSRIEGFYECPDLFELPVDGKPQTRKWVLTAASSEYMIGAFDGQKFTPETGKLPGHRGHAFYAAQTYRDIAPQDGRCLQIGWGQMAAPGMPFNQMMTFPCELKLRTTPEGVRLCFQPVKEIEKLHSRGHRWESVTLKPGENPLEGITGELLDIRIEFETGDAGEIGFNLRGVPVVYDAKKQTLACQDREAPLPAAAGKVRLQILVDRTSLEIFGNDGLLYMPMRVVPKTDDKSPALFARGGPARILSLQVFELNSAWPQP